MAQTTSSRPKKDLPDGCLTVSAVGGLMRSRLEGEGPVVVVGEVSGLKAGASGHWSFELKDKTSRLRVFMFFADTKRQPQPKDGEEIVVFGVLTFKAEYGAAQLRATRIQALGDGDAQRKLDALKDKLRQEGLFDLSRKKPLPYLPGCVGLVTSRHGEALKDALRVIKERNQRTHVVLRATNVQGHGSVGDIAEAIRALSALKLCDVILVVRGGGAREDLVAFDSEPVARAIAMCSVPVVTGIGHEGDTTLADLVADVRAATPSQAAERAVPAINDVEARVFHLHNRLHAHAKGRLAHAEQRLSRLERRLPSSDTLVATLGVPLAQLEKRLNRQAPRERLRSKRQQLDELVTRLKASSPREDVLAVGFDVDMLRQRLDVAMFATRDHAASRLANMTASLDALSPTAVLSRGFAMVTVPDDGFRTATAPDLTPGRTLRVRVTGAVADVAVTRRLDGDS